MKRLESYDEFIQNEGLGSYLKKGFLTTALTGSLVSPTVATETPISPKPTELSDDRIVTYGFDEKTDYLLYTIRELLGLGGRISDLTKKDFYEAEQNLNNDEYTQKIINKIPKFSEEEILQLQTELDWATSVPKKGVGLKYERTGKMDVQTLKLCVRFLREFNNKNPIISKVTTDGKKSYPYGHFGK
jgi:hypothetical protein